MNGNFFKNFNLYAVLVTYLAVFFAGAVVLVSTFFSLVTSDLLIFAVGFCSFALDICAAFGDKTAAEVTALF